MTTFKIKLFAITFMVIDHVGMVFFPQIFLLRAIGRLAFPLFAWLIANGAYHTKNMNKYLLRLFIFALISQIPFILMNKVFDPYFWGCDVLFTLLLGLIAVILIKKSKNIFISLLIVAICAGIAEILNTDYAALGVLTVIAFYFSFNNMKKMIVLQMCVITFFIVIPLAIIIAFNGAPSPLIPASSLILCGMSCLEGTLKLHYSLPVGYVISISIEILALLSLFIIAFYNNQQGWKMKYFFYWFYPAHMLIIFLVKLFFLRI